MKAMIMAAGVGSRLDPVTQSIPKPLVPVANRPVMDILLENLSQIGVKEVIANTYYLADKIIKRYSKNPYGVESNYIIEDNLSGTAGDLKKSQFFFDRNEDFVVLSADGLSNADLEKGIKIHRASGAIATIGIKKVPMEDIPNFGVVVTNENGFITEFQEKPSIEEAKSNFINTGIYIFNYRIFEFIPKNTFYDFAKNVFPVLLSINQINTFEIEGYWSDIGTLQQYKQSTQDLFNGLCHFSHSKINETDNGRYITATPNINAKILGNCTIGCNCSFGENVVLENSIILDNVKVGDNVKIKDSIVSSNCFVGVDLYSQVIGANQHLENERVNV